MGKRADEIMNAMSLKQEKNAEYSDATPAVRLALASVQKACAETSSAVAAQVGGDEEMMQSICVNNAAMLHPVLNQSYYIRKEVMGWDARF